MANTPLISLLSAIHELWSGRIDIKLEEESLGHIVLHEGRIVWAACRGQSETLGIFLWRLGRITREQLAEVQQTFKKQQGKKKLGAILEESGLMSRPVLRRCLLLHTRTAVESLLAYANTTAELHDIIQDIDEKITFGPEEVLPQEISDDLVSQWTCPDSAFAHSWHRRTAENAILEDLAVAPGYRAAVIITHNGDMLTGHLQESGLDLSLISVFMASILESATRAAGASAIQAVSFMLLECTHGCLMAQWIDEKRHYLLFLLVDQEADLYETKRLFTMHVPTIVAWIQRGREVRLHEAIARGLPLEQLTRTTDDEPASSADQVDPPSCPPPVQEVLPAAAAQEHGTRSKQDPRNREHGAAKSSPDVFAATRLPGSTADEKDIFSGIRRNLLAEDEPDIFSEVRRQVANTPDIFSAARKVPSSDSDIFSSVRPNPLVRQGTDAFSAIKPEPEQRSDVFATKRRDPTPPQTSNAFSTRRPERQTEVLAAESSSTAEETDEE